jgi:hypothetical protein
MYVYAEWGIELDEIKRELCYTADSLLFISNHAGLSIP